MKKQRFLELLCLFVVVGLFINSGHAQSAKKTLVAGDLVPQFSLTDQDGKVFNVADFIGKKVMVFYFYPKDESMVCTKEACAFRDSFDQFKKAGAMVIGIN